MHFQRPITIFSIVYDVASSVSRKMNRILLCDWLPERARLPALPREKKLPERHIINLLSNANLRECVRLPCERIVSVTLH